MTDRSSFAVATASGGEATTLSDGEGQSRPSRLSDDEVPRPSLLQRIGLLLGLKRNHSGSDLVRSIANDMDGAVTPAEQAMFQNILHLRQVRVEDVMVPRAELEAVAVSTTLGELFHVFGCFAHSCMLVFVGSFDYRCCMCRIPIIS